MKADASHALETSRRIVKEEDDNALEIQKIREAEKRLAATINYLTAYCNNCREIEKKYENKLKEQNRSWSREIERMSETYNQKVIELEFLGKKHQEEIEAVKSDLQDAKVVSYSCNI